MRYFRFLFICTLALIGLLSACMPNGQDPQVAFDRGAAALAACVQTKCDRLNLDGSNLADFSVLNDMPHITALMVSYSNFDDLADISQMRQLKELHISNTRLTDLQGLSQFPNLTILHVANLTAVSDLTPIAGLANLQELAVDGGTNGDISYLADMPRLKKLSIDQGRIADLTPLTKIKSLTDLSIFAKLPADLTPLLDIPNLKRIAMLEYQVPEDIQQKLHAKGIENVELIVVVC